MTRKLSVHDLTSHNGNIILGNSLEHAKAIITDGDVDRLRELNGQYGIVGRNNTKSDVTKYDVVRLARSVAQPLRYAFVDSDGGESDRESHVFVSDRIETIMKAIRNEERLQGVEFHFTYTRMVPAHTLVELCFSETGYQHTRQTRFLEPIEQPSDIRTIGEAYGRAVYEAVKGFIEQVPEQETIGIPLSGGADSGMVYVLANVAYRELGKDPAKLKAITLKLGQGGTDTAQAQRLVQMLSHHGFPTTQQWNILEIPAHELPSLEEVVEGIEDYKTFHDLQDATVSAAFRKKLREAFPALRYTMTGQGGDEVCQDYNVKEVGVTFEEVMENPHLYVEGRIHIRDMLNPMFSGGLGRRVVRDYAPAQRYGFIDFSPICTPRVVRTIYGVPKQEMMTNEEDLYHFKIAITNTGVEAVTSISYNFPPKRRFQVGASDPRTFSENLSSLAEPEARQLFYKIMSQK